jgi:hypothetical protein
MTHVRHQFTVLRGWAVLLALAAVQVVAFGQSTASVTHYKYSWGVHVGPLAPLQSAACSGLLAVAQAASPGSNIISEFTGPASCKMCNNGDCANYGSWATMGTQAVTTAMPCPAAGSTGSRNLTMGYSNSPNQDSFVSTQTSASVPQYGSTQCVTGGGAVCAATLTDMTNCWASTQPTATGLYRFSCDYTVTFTGAACTASQADKDRSDNSTVPPPCPGTFGTINSKPVCLPSESTTTLPAPQTSSSVPTNVQTGNPPAGSNGQDTLPNRAPASGNGANAGSPASAQDGVSVPYGKGAPANAGTAAGNGGGSGTGTGGGSVTVNVPPQPTDCDKDPTRIGCSQYGEPDNSVRLSTRDSGFSSIVPVAFAGGGSCPAPASFSARGHSYSLSFQGICANSVDYIRPIVLVIGAALAAFVFIGGFRS